MILGRSTPEPPGYVWRQKIGFPLGIGLGGLMLLLPTPQGLAPEAQRAGAVAALMATWWVTEAVPIAVTALVPLLLYPVLSVMDMTQAAAPYADPNVFLFMGGFMIAMAMEKWGLHKRLGLHVIAWVGGGPRRILWGFMAATAFISMWVSNTATAMMMLPVAMAVLGRFDLEAAPTSGRVSFGTVLMLGIAYAASVGGVATLVGTPPNVIFAGQAKALFPELGEVSFVRWTLFGFPVALGFLILTWGYLAFVHTRLERGVGVTPEAIRDELKTLGPWTRGERGVMTVFLLTAALWMGRADVEIGEMTLRGWPSLLGLKGIHDGTVAMGAALVLFATPVSFTKVDFLLDWTWARRMPWDVLLLLGGGFALAESFRRTGLDAWIGSRLEMLEGIPTALLILFLSLGVMLVGNFTSNTAIAAILVPMVASAAGPLQVHPYLVMIPATLAASFDFMLPAGTPPNAIVYGSGYVTIPQMVRAGLPLTLLGALWITLATYLFVIPVFGGAPALPGRSLAIGGAGVPAGDRLVPTREVSQDRSSVSF
jgi:sodium-dependent dicarboxylate transporter 2/3/5